MTSSISEQQFANGFLHLLRTNTPIFSATHAGSTNHTRRPITLAKMPSPKRKRTNALTDAGSSTNDSGVNLGSQKTFSKVTLKSIKAPKFAHIYESFAVGTNYTVLDLKQRIIDDSLVPAGSELRFLLKGKVLKDSGLVSDLGDEGAEVAITVLVTAPPVGSAPTTSAFGTSVEEKKEEVNLNIDEPVWKQIGQVLENAYGPAKANMVLSKLKTGYKP